jgi:RHS repeat-associated protein
MDSQKNNAGNKGFVESFSKESTTKSNALEIPQISLPKGGGALKGIDEKFQVNAANGTASFSIPLPFSPNRNGFTPQLTLSYNSGTGNSLFGIGWDLGLPAIQRRTDKKLPRYFDNNDVEEIEKEDSFMFSGVEELVPKLNLKNDKWVVEQKETDDFFIREYRPRIEGGFNKIERIYQKSTKSFYWRVTSRENITTFFGFSEQCRIADPTDKAKVFQWLPEFSFDDKGSWVWYEYKNADLTNIEDTVHEKNRIKEIALFSNKHLKNIKYGNQQAYYLKNDLSPYQIQFPENQGHFFEVVFDYGEFRESDFTSVNNWPSRNDAYSIFRSGFEMRTYRLCKRVLMFHDFEELGGKTLVRSLDFEYDTSNNNIEQATELTYLTGILQKGYVKIQDGYSQKSLPKITFDYQWLKWNKEIKNVSKESLIHSPVGLSDNYQWVDLYNEGVNGILTEQANGWYYKSNLGENEDGVNFSHAQAVIPKPSFTGLSNGVLTLQDLEANGEKQLVVNSPGLQGYFELNDEGNWQPFKAFLKTLNINLKDPNIRMLDVNGDGKPEVVLSDQGAFWWWENDGNTGYDSPELATKPYDEERGAAIIFADQEQRIFLADMCGDGLTDIVRIRNGEICYWANMGYGRFGAKVTMSNSPIFDNPDLFNPAYLQLTDISGTGATDIIYLGKNKFRAYLNYSGNAWSDAEEIDPFFPTEQPNKIAVTDLLGNGTSCIVWSSDMPAYSASPMRYIDLMGGKKPHIMVSHENGMGKKTTVEYKSSTQFYLKDKLTGTPWITKLAFPVQVVSKTIITDEITNVRFSAEYSYHHGYYDHSEREFRGFGRVEQTDTEEFDVFSSNEPSNVNPKEHHQPPVLTKTWFHTGAFFDKEKILTHLKKEYWQEEFKKKGFESTTIEYELPDAILLLAENIPDLSIDKLSAEEWREALRACKGMTLRQEVFGLDAEKRISDEKQAKNYEDGDLEYINFQKEAFKTEQIPYSVATHNCEIQILQQKGKNHYASFTINESEAINYSYERNAEDPRIAHSLTIETDELGNVLESVSVVYPRLLGESLLKDAPNDSNINRQAKKKARDGQKKQWITFTKNSVTNDIINSDSYYLRKNWQTQTFEITGIKPIDNKQIFSINDFKNKVKDFVEIEYQQKASEGLIQKRLIEHIKTKFYNENLTLPLSDGQIAPRSIPFESYQLAYTPNLLEYIFSPSPFSAQFEVTENDMREAKYLQDNTNWWVQSGTIKFNRDGENFDDIKNRFFAPVAYLDQFDSESEVEYDTRNLFMRKATAIIDRTNNVFNETEILRFNYRLLSPEIIKDTNDNISSSIADELGLPKASAIEGKALLNALQGDEADNLNGFKEQTEADELAIINSFFEKTNVIAPQICNYTEVQEIARTLLGNATSRMVYDFSRKPSVVASIIREKHSKENPTNSPLQISFEYTDGLGKVAMKKVQAEAGLVTSPDGIKIDTGNQLRWVGNGRTVLNNKGNPIKQYEPYFSTTPAYENDPIWVEQGVSPIIYYDGAGRNIKTELPNGTFTKVVFDAWKQETFDVNDTIKDSLWFKERIVLPNSNPEFKAAKKSEVHYDTPSIIVLDTLGRPTLGIDHNRWEDSNGIKEEFTYTHSEIDIEGNAQSITDARGNILMTWRYDMLGHRVTQTSMDAGKRWMLNDAAGKPIKLWDERQYEFLYLYDKQHRPTQKWIKGGDGLIPLNHCYENIIYGETQAEAKVKNLKGQAAILYDTAGKIISERHDFKGNLLSSSRIFAKDYKNTPHWDVPDPETLLEGDKYTFTQSTEYDALNRPIRQTTPDSKITMPQFNAAGFLEKVILKDGTTETEHIKNIDYDAKGQRERIQYGNNVSTKYTYDPLTFRLNNLKSTKLGGELLQDLQYTYDPTGNITQIQDNAIPVVFFNNQKVAGKNEYTYDALYRLISATGREQNSNSPNFGNEDNWNDASSMFTHGTGDIMAMRNYTQRYQYDVVGNILQMKHTSGDNGSWTRDNLYETKNNRLKSTSIGSNTYNFKHHTQHGYMISMAHLSKIDWTFKEEILSTAKQEANNKSPETTYYVYDGNGQRVRKITEKEAEIGVLPTIKDERTYVGAYEVYRNENGLERETLHVMDDKSRIMMLDTETEPRTFMGIPTGRTTRMRTIRYQMSNHLSSISLELDENAQTISFEEYYPYGTTAYQAKSSNIQAAAKRYRYTGMERDEETGLAYHSARYYMPWLGRWCSADPVIIKDGLNLFRYVNNNPISYIDTNGKEGLKLRTPVGYRTVRITEYEYSNASSAGINERKNPDGSYSADIPIYGTEDTPSKPKPKPQPKPQPKQEKKEDSCMLGCSVTLDEAFNHSPSKEVLEEVFEGDFYDGEPTLLGTVANVIIGFIPYAGQVADARDITAASNEVRKTPTSGGSWAMLAISGVAMVPGIGDAAKGSSKLAKWAAHVAKWTSKWGDEGAELIGKAIKDRRKLRAAMKIGKGVEKEAHHLIPIQALKESEVVQAALLKGFDINGVLNGVELAKDTHLAGHGEWNQLVLQQLEHWAKEHPNFTGEQAKGFLENTLLPRLRQEWRDVNKL